MDPILQVVVGVFALSGVLFIGSIAAIEISAFCVEWSLRRKREAEELEKAKTRPAEDIEWGAWGGNDPF